MGNTKLISLLTAVLLIFSSATNTYGVELTITDNGQDSESEINIQQENSVSTEQSNNSEVANDINVVSNTGGNTASDNVSDEVNISTGDVKTDVVIQNSTNTSTADSSNCCISDTNATISGNGQGSSNTINLGISNTSEAIVSQTANITNNISGTSNTGGNTANDNFGNVSIKTGNIKTLISINNDPVNFSSVSLVSGSGGVSADISANAKASVNDINLKLHSEANAFVNSSSEIKNYVVWDSNTGGNSAGDNLGEVSIKTGDIDFELFINNLVNLGAVNIDGCCDLGGPSDPDDPGDPGDPHDPGEGNGSGDGSSNGGSSSSGTLLSEAAATEAGGPGIAGLSDTGSAEAQRIFYLAGFVLMTLGIRYIGKSLESRRLKTYSVVAS